MVKKVNFKTNTLLKNLVGKDLINDDNIAVVELVKNSFDAKSPTVEVKFLNFTENETTDNTSSKIIISDAGTGMSEIDIKEKWLNIAYSEKKEQMQKENAFYAGNKGIGRFSCDRLGERLDLITRKNNGELLHLKINWLDFEVENKKDLTIQQIDVELSRVSESRAEVISHGKIPKHGTILVISNLRSIWNRDLLVDLRRNLERFINPNQMFSKKQFIVKLIADDLLDGDTECEDHRKVNGTIKNVIFEKLKFKSTYIEAKINQSGSEVESNLFHDGDCIFKLKERNSSYPNLKNIQIVIYFLNPYKKAYFKRETGIRSIDFGSIFLFLNGFRVAPYGERGNDWLGMDVRKTQGQQRFLGNRDVIGRIEVIDNEEKFKPISSREGIKNTPAAIELRERFFDSTLRKLEKFVVDGLDWDSVPLDRRNELIQADGLDWKETSERYAESWDRKKQRIATSIMNLIGTDKNKVLNFWFNAKLLEDIYEDRREEVNKLLSDINGFSDDTIDVDLKKELKKIGQIIGDKNKQLEKKNNEIDDLRVKIKNVENENYNLSNQNQSFVEQSLFLKSIATVDKKNLLGFLHQVCLDSSIIDNYIIKVMRDIRSGQSSKETIKNMEKISKANKRIMATAQFASKANFKSGAKKEITNIPLFFEQYITNVAKDFIASNVKIVIHNEYEDVFELNARRIELSILIDNLISNADKAHAKTINVYFYSRSKNNLTISFVDDGNGLAKSISSPLQAFDLGVTSTNGSGLGLFHSKEIVESLGGTIALIPSERQGVEIKMVFTK